MTIHEIYSMLQDRIKAITLFCISATTVAVIYSLTLPNIFSSQAIFYENTIYTSSPSDGRGLSSIIGLTGANESEFSSILKARLYSSDFLKTILETHPNFPAYIFNTNQLSKDFLADDSKLFSLLLKYKSKVEFNYESSSGFIQIIVFSFSSNQAQEFLQIITQSLESDYKRIIKNKSNGILGAFRNIIETEQSLATRNALANIMSSELIKLVTNEKRVSKFIYLEPPSKPLKRYSPRRSLIVISIFFLSLFMSLLYIYLRMLFKQLDFSK